MIFASPENSIRNIARNFHSLLPPTPPKKLAKTRSVPIKRHFNALFVDRGKARARPRLNNGARGKIDHAQHFRNARLTAGDPPDFVYILMEGPANIMVGA
jgi:hypothetical protein